MKHIFFLILAICFQNQSAFAESKYIEFDISNIASIDGLPNLGFTHKSVRAKLEDVVKDGTHTAYTDEQVEFKMPNGDPSVFVQFRFAAVMGKEATGRNSAIYSSDLSGAGIISASSISDYTRLRSLDALLSTTTSARYEYSDSVGRKIIVDLRADIENFRLTE